MPCVNRDLKELHKEGTTGAPGGSWHCGSFCLTWLGSVDICSTLPCVHVYVHTHTHPCTLLIPKYCYTQTFTHSHAAWGDMLKDLTPTVRQYPLLSTAQQPPSPQRHGHPSLLRNTGRRCLAQPSSALGSCTIMPQLSEAYIWDTG